MEKLKPAKPAYQTIRLILGDQLNELHSWFSTSDPDVLYVVAEMQQETGYVRHHVQKVCAFFAAMSRFSARLSDLGHKVQYLTLVSRAKLRLCAIRHGEMQPSLLLLLYCISSELFVIYLLFLIHYMIYEHFLLVLVLGLDHDVNTGVLP